SAADELEALGVAEAGVDGVEQARGRDRVRAERHRLSVRDAGRVGADGEARAAPAAGTAADEGGVSADDAVVGERDAGDDRQQRAERLPDGGEREQLAAARERQRLVER